MLERWGLEPMKPFEQVSVKRKERLPIEDISAEPEVVAGLNAHTPLNVLA